MAVVYVMVRESVHSIKTAPYVLAHNFDMLVLVIHVACSGLRYPVRFCHSGSAADFLSIPASYLLPELRPDIIFRPLVRSAIYKLS